VRARAAALVPAVDVELACLDTSKAACDLAAKLFRGDVRTFVAVADATRDLPFSDGSLDVALSVFAPRNPHELARVLKPGGRVVVASAEPEHMCELRELFDGADVTSSVKVLGIEPGKAARVGEAMAEAGFTLAYARSIRGFMELCDEDVVALIQMGPSGHHNTEEDVARAVREVSRGGVTKVTKAFSVAVYVNSK
jgi:23S rRNA (guanine745-N1)-methyltransferase